MSDPLLFVLACVQAVLSIAALAFALYAAFSTGGCVGGQFTSIETEGGWVTHE